jgi:single-stranded DNA-binding protein
MTAHVELHGHLCRPPERRMSNIRPMTSALLVVQLGRGEDVPEWFALAAFGRLGEALAKHAKGDAVSVSGKLTKASWKTRDGAERAGFSVLLDGIGSVRTVGHSVVPDELDEALAG